MAFGVVAAAVWLLRLVADGADRRLSGAVQLLLLFVAAQVLLGVEAWMIRFAGLGLTLPEEVLWRRDLVRSAHVLMGALILATSVVATLEAFRRAAPAAGTVRASVGRLEGAA